MGNEATNYPHCIFQVANIVRNRNDLILTGLEFDADRMRTVFVVEEQGWVGEFVS